MNEAIKPAIKRLFDAQTHWRRAEASYFSPDEFRISINACIQELRNVTFVLQNNKRKISGFDEWYLPWQKKMRANRSLKWLVQARNRIVKQGDLEINSILRISVGSYIEEEIPFFELSLDPKLTNEDIYQIASKSGLPNEVFNKSYVKIERRWVDIENPEYEMLDLLGSCWLSIAQLLNDAPDQIINKENRKIEWDRVPPCMHSGSESRSIWMKVQNDNLIPVEMDLNEIEPADIDETKTKYSDSPLFNDSEKPNNFIGLCEHFFKQAMYFLKKDGYHIHLVMLFVENKPAQILELRNEDQADKYRTFRLVASEVEKIGADSFIMISEIWEAPFDPAHPYQHAVESPFKTEALSLIGASEQGEGISFIAQFTRHEDEIEFGTVLRGNIVGINSILPILSVWKNKVKKMS